MTICAKGAYHPLGSYWWNLGWQWSGTTLRRAFLQRSFDNLFERKIELRIQRLSFAASVIESSGDMKRRFQAAYVIDLDGYLLDSYFENANVMQFDSPRLSDPAVRESIDIIRRRVQQTNADLMTKSRLLFTGLHWWLRGRYGMGPLGYGMLKTFQALESAQSQFPLYMPRETPIPTDPFDSKKNPVPEIDRRHHYIWMYEYRTIASQITTSADHQHVRKTTPTEIVRFDRFY